MAGLRLHLSLVICKLALESLLIPHRTKEGKHLEGNKTLCPQHFSLCILKLEITGIKRTFHSVIDFDLIIKLFLRRGEESLLVQTKKNPTGQI